MNYKYCVNCKHCIQLEVAFDDERLYCNNDATKSFDLPVGYLTVSWLACPLYEEAAKGVVQSAARTVLESQLSSQEL
jgi:hypothetical protein